MSKVKSPTEKKQLSLTRDRRNTYRENDKASRKNIPRAKSKSHRSERRAIGQILADVSLKIDAPEQSEALARSKARKKKVKAFKKSPDRPLGVYLAEQSKRRLRRDKA